MNIIRLNNDSPKNKIVVRGNGGSNSGGGSTGGELKRNDVNFFDYDGTLLYSYSWDEAKKLTELPALPVHPEYEVREWNYTLEDIKEQGVDSIMVADGFYIPLDTITINGVEYKKYKWADEESEWYMIHKSSDAVEVGTICYWYYDDGEDSYIDVDDDGNPWEDPIQDVISIIGKADVGACVYDNGEQVYVVGVTILERGTTEIPPSDYVNNPCFGVYSIPNTVTYIDSNAFYKFTYLHELKFPISIEDIKESYSAFQYSFVLNTWWNGVNRTLDYKCDYGVVLDIQEGVTYINLGTSATIMHVKFPTTVSHIYYLTYSNQVPLLYNFSKVKDVPLIDNNYIGRNSKSMIVVPDNLYNKWINATNWSEIAENIYKVSELAWINNL